MALDLIRLLVGEVPIGLEYLEYVTGTIIALYTIKFIYEMFIFVFNLLPRRR